jgi:ketosteroid isomerase-like protein
MKTILFVMMLFFFFPGYASQVPTLLTSHNQDTTTKEIREVVKVIFQSLEKMDVQALFQSYSNSSDFVFFTTDGSMVDWQAAKNHHAAWFNSLSALQVTTIGEYFRFLPGNTVICSWTGKFEMTMKTGEQLKINRFGITFIFNKIDNKWKVIHQHSSSLPPSQQ